MATPRPSSPLPLGVGGGMPETATPCMPPKTFDIGKVPCIPAPMKEPRPGAGMPGAPGVGDRPAVVAGMFGGMSPYNPAVELDA